MQDASTRLFLGRQPIVNRHEAIFGYQLLFRNGYSQNRAVFQDGQSASAELLHNSLMGFGLHQLVGEHKAFINFSQSFFEQQQPPFFRPTRVVCQLTKEIKPNTAIIQGIKRLKAEGYQMALDDVMFKKEFLPFIELADYVKIEVHQAPHTKLASLIDKLSKVTHAKFLAEKIEDPDTFRACHNAGFDYFLGFYFARPEILSTQKVPIGKQNIMALLAAIVHPNINLHSLQHIIERDVGLTHKLMIIAQEYRTATMPKFHNLKDVMMMFGLKRMQSWATMISMSLAENVMPEVFQMSFIRANCLRRMAIDNHWGDEESFFIVGLFSLLETIMQQPMETILKQLDLTETINEALLHGQGKMGEALAMCVDIEQGNGGVTSLDIKMAYLTAVQEALKIHQLL